MPKVWWWFGGLLHLTANVYGQVDRGGLTGTVKDSSGLAVPRAKDASHSGQAGGEALRNAIPIEFTICVERAS